MKSTFGAGRDFRVLDMSEQQQYPADGKISVRLVAEIRDAHDAVRYRVTGKMMGIPRRMTITDTDGREVASLKATMFSPIKSRMTMTMADGADWQLEGSLLEKEYAIAADGRPVAQITQKWATVRDTYVLDVAEGVDVGLALAVLWAVDRWVERD